MSFENMPELPKKTPVVAVIAFVSSLLIPLTFGMAFAPAILCGILALCMTFPNENTRRKRWFAISALVISFLFVVTVVSFMAYMFFSWYQIETLLVDRNMQRLGRAVLEFHGDKGHFPIYMTEKDTDENYPHSWRVQILPYLGEKNLYEQIRLNEPWDSPWNRQFHDKMPEIFRNPNRNLTIGHTTYSVVTGEDTLFCANKISTLKEIAGDLDTTFLLVEGPAVCWMNPEGNVPVEKCLPLGAPGGILEADFSNSLKIQAFKAVTSAGTYYVLPSNIGAHDFQILAHKSQTSPKNPLENFYYQWQQHGSEHFTVIQNVPGCKRATGYSQW